MKVQELTALTLGIRKPARTFPEASVALETASHGPPPQVKRVIKGKARPSRVQLPAISWPLLRLFTWYSGKYLQKHFHAVRLSRAGFPPKVGDAPLVIYSNHASWWDPLLGLVLRQKCFPNRSLYAPMDTKMLRRY